MRRAQFIAIFMAMLLSCGPVYANGLEEVAKIQQQIIDRSIAKLTGFSKAQEEAIRKIIAEENPMMFDIKEIDLDEDGQSEIVFTYSVGAHSSGAKVIKFSGDEPIVLFEHGSSTLNTQFKIVGNVPTLIFEESDLTPDYNTGKRYEEIYRWDGKMFSKTDGSRSVK